MALNFWQSRDSRQVVGQTPGLLPGLRGSPWTRFSPEESFHSATSGPDQGSGADEGIGVKITHRPQICTPPIVGGVDCISNPLWLRLLIFTPIADEGVRPTISPANRLIGNLFPQPLRTASGISANFQCSPANDRAGVSRTCKIRVHVTPSAAFPFGRHASPGSRPSSKEIGPG
jgi:hypothetical protein